MQVVLSLAVDSCTMDNQFVYFVIANHDTLHNILSESARLRYDELVHSFEAIDYTVRGLLLLVDAAVNRDLVSYYC